CGQEIQVHRIERDDALIDRLIQLERKFWQYVIDDTPPPADGSDSAQTALQCLYPFDNHQCMDFTDNESLCGDFDELIDVRERLSRMEQQEARLKQRIQQAMGDASKAVFHRGEVTWKRSKDSIGLNSKALLEDQPDL